LSQKLANKKSIVIIGAGPAGLTAAYELSKYLGYKITIIEQSNQVGGISKTVNYKDNLIDLGGHRFFSKHDEVLRWWSEIMPLHAEPDVNTINYQNKSKVLPTDLNNTNKQNSLLIRPRKSRIYYNQHFFDYPLQLKPKLLKNLGLYKSLKITLGILKSRVNPIKEEKNLEDFYINRFGKELYNTFFKDYTRKVWGKECHEISDAWGRQRVKTLSIRRIIFHSLKNVLGKPKGFSKKTETSLVEHFLYPAKGPGQMWEKVRDKCLSQGVKIEMEAQLKNIWTDDENKVSKISFLRKGSDIETLNPDYLISSMPVRPLIEAFTKEVPDQLRSIARNLEYRDFLIVGLLANTIKLKNKQGKRVTDNWLYIQDRNVMLGRLQLFNNWSPYMVANPKQTWLGAEYFCYRHDDLWKMKDKEIIDFAAKELESIGVLDAQEVVDGTVVRCPKAYPSYTGVYEDFNEIVSFLKSHSNLIPIGRNGMHKYNNQDHSMLTAFKARDLILSKSSDFEKLWKINTDSEYLEEKN